MNLYTPEDIKQQLSLVDNEWIGEYDGYELRSVFQPILTQDLDYIYGYEGLVRVKKQGESITPLDFFSKFTQETEITNVGGLCASLHLRNFSQAKLEGKLFLNSHPTMFARIANDGYTFSKIMERIYSEDFTPEDIIWEITQFKESDTESLLSTIELLKTTGFQIAVDDYGQQASTEKRIELLQPNIIKLNRSLIQDFCENRSVLLLLLGKMLYERGFNIVLEGVETFEEQRMLQAVPHHFVQGFLYGEPTLTHAQFQAKHKERLEKKDTEYSFDIM